MSRLPPGLPAHVATTRHLGAAYPLVSEAGLGHEGVLIGRDLLGGSFVYDPFTLYQQGAVTNPNMVVIGQIGRGKSSFVKSYLWRQAVFGRHAWVVDPKGEYGRLAEAWGVVPLSLRPGGTIRLNPLDTDASGDGPGPGTDPVADGRRRRTDLTASLAIACLGRDLLPRERAAVDAAVGAAEDRARDGAMDAPTLPQVVEALLDPGADAASALRTTRTDLMEEGRDVALELRRLVHGDLQGMFDGPSTTIDPMADDDRPYVIYTRLSEVRAGDKAPSLADQAKLCTQYLESQGLPVGPVLEERGKTASKPAKERPVFKEMMQRIEAGQFGGVIVWKMDRLTRQMVQQGPILAALQRSGARLVSVTETLDTTTPMGKAIVGFVVAQAEQESLNTSLRVAKAEQRRIEAGLPHGGGKRSFGYGRDTGDRVADAKTRNVVNKAEAKVIRQVAKSLTAGESLRQIAQWLNDNQITTTTGRTWSHSTLRQMISSPKLRGERIHNGKTTPLENWTAILTAEEQFAALDAVDKARSYRSSAKRVKNRYLLSGLIHCAKCDAPMYPHHGASVKDMRYMCRVEGSTSHCARSIVVRRTDDFVFGCAIDYSDQHPELLIPIDRGEEEAEGLRSAINVALADLKTLRTEKFATQDVDERATFDGAIEMRQNALDRLRPQFARLEARLEQKKPSRVGITAEPWYSPDMAVRKAWLRQYVDRVWVEKGNPGGNGFDTGRISIEWLHGEYVPTDPMDDANAESLQIYEDMR